MPTLVIRSVLSRSRPLVLALAALVLAVVLVAPAAQAGDGGGSANKPAQPGKPIPGHYIVTVKRGAEPKRVAEHHGAQAKFVYRDALNGFAAELNDHQVEALRHNPNVTAVEQDQLGGVQSTQYMNSYGDPYGLDRIDQPYLALNRTYVYSARGSGVRAYVIDTGIQTSHPEFGGRASAVYDAVGDGRNGQDCHGHGTHVAGTIGGSTYGVGKSVMLRSVRILDCGGYGSVSQAIAGVDWAKRNAVKPAVANMSVGWPYSASLNQAVTNLANSGVFVAVAAGNENTLACNRSPASAPGTFTVGSSDKTDTRAYDSNYGGCVDGYAPGVNTLSAGLGGTARYMSGTSMATPHVTGVIALAKSAYGDGYTTESWVNWLISNSTTNVIRSNPSGTPNRLLYKGGL